MSPRTHAHSPITAEAANILGSLIRAARIERGWTQKDLAERVGVAPYTIWKVEHGDLGVALGTAFEAAVVCGVPLFEPERSRLVMEERRLADRLTLLPKRARRAAEVDDDF
jgi:transcriptional regulator with XRE-family HTH domain